MTWCKCCILIIFIQGTRVALTEQGFEAQLESGKREAMKSFGDKGGSIGGFFWEV